MSDFTFESPIDLSDLEIKRVRLHHWVATPAPNGPSGKIGFNSTGLIPEWSDGSVWHGIYPPHEPFVRDGFALVTGDQLAVDVFVGYLNGVAGQADALSDAITLTLGGKAAGSTAFQTAGVPVVLNVTGLTVAAGDIALANGKLLRGNVGGTASAVDASSIALNSWGAPTGDISFGGYTITNIRDPINAQDAASRSWVLGVLSGVSPKTPVRVATAAALPAYDPPVGGAQTVITATANAALTIDGVAVVASDRVLVKDESGGNEEWNGVYSVTNAGSAGTKWVLTRAIDADSDAEVSTGDEYFVSTGDDNGGTKWALQTAEPITVGTTGLTFVQTGGSGEYSAGNGLTVVGRVFHFATSGAYTEKAVAYATSTTTMGFTDAGVQYEVLTAGVDGTPAFGKVQLDQAAAVNGTLQTANGGTGQSSLAIGDLPLGNGASNPVYLLSAVAAGKVLISKGVATKPDWDKVNLNTAADTTAGPTGSHIQGVLQVANGGTGRATLTARGLLYGNGTGQVSMSSGGSSWQFAQAAGGGAFNEPTFVTLQGDVAAAGGEGAGFVRIESKAVNFAKMQDIAQHTVIGRYDTGVGVPQSITAGTAGHVLRRSGSVLGFGALDLANSNTFSGILPTTKGGTGINSPLVFVPHGGQVPHFRKITLSSGSQIYTIAHGYGNSALIATLVDSDGRVVMASMVIDATNVTVTFGFVTTKGYTLMLCGHTETDTWAP